MSTHDYMRDRRSAALTESNRTLLGITSGDIACGPDVAREIAARHEGEYGDAFDGSPAEVLKRQAKDANGGAEPGPRYCRYSPRHLMEGVPATVVIDCGRAVGMVPACDGCAELYGRLNGTA